MNSLTLYNTFLIAGLYEGTVLVFNIEENFKNVFTSTNFNAVSKISFIILIFLFLLKPVIDVFFTKNASAEDVFAVNTANGQIHLLNINFETYCTIPTYNKTSVSIFKF